MPLVPAKPFFDRVVSVQVGTRLIEDLRMTFKVKKKIKKSLNELDLRIYNLSEISRKELQTNNEYVLLLAGYPNNVEVIFSGDAMQITHYKDGSDWISHIEASDGIRKKRSKRVSKSFGKGAKASDVAIELAKATDFGIGNAITELRKGNVRNALTEFAHGYVAVGNASEQFDKIVRTMGYDWSIQDDSIQVVSSQGVVGDEIVLLTPETGLIGSPEVGDEGYVRATSLIQQRLLPGKAVHLISEQFDGIYRIEEVEFDGDTHNNNWYANLEMSTVKL